MSASPARYLLYLIALPLVLFLGVWLFMIGTATRLHPSPKDIPSVTSVAPMARWTGAVAQGRQIIRATLSEKNLPGLSVAVGIDGELAWSEGFGYADLRMSAPVTPNHRFRMGTASTVLTSAAAGLLLADGRLALDDEIQKYVPAFPKKKWPVTLRQVMAHTAGIAPDGGDEGPLFTKHCEHPAEALQYFAKDELLFEPGTKFRFSNYGWILVSAAIETATAQPFLGFMKEQVFDPLGLRDTGPDSGSVEGDDDFPLFNLFREILFDPRTARASNAGPSTTKSQNPKSPAPLRVTSYFPRFAADPNYGLHLMRPLDYSCYAGSSAFVSTPSDLVRFGMAIRGGKLLKPATVDLLQTPQQLTSGTGKGQSTGYGLGWNLESMSLAGKRTIAAGHDGDSLGGQVATLLTLPEQGIVVAVMSNISYADTFSLAQRIAQAFAEPGATPATK